jgi:hypothetical protein
MGEGVRLLDIHGVWLWGGDGGTLMLWKQPDGFEYAAAEANGCPHVALRFDVQPTVEMRISRCNRVSPKDQLGDFLGQGLRGGVGGDLKFRLTQSDDALLYVDHGMLLFVL